MKPTLASFLVELGESFLFASLRSRNAFLCMNKSSALNEFVLPASKHGIDSSSTETYALSFHKEYLQPLFLLLQQQLDQTSSRARLGLSLAPIYMGSTPSVLEEEVFVARVKG